MQKHAKHMALANTGGENLDFRHHAVRLWKTGGKERRLCSPKGSGFRPKILGLSTYRGFALQTFCGKGSAVLPQKTSGASKKRAQMPLCRIFPHINYTP